MFKKFLALSMVFAFLNVHATTPVNNLKLLSKAYDNLNFALTVEWDQKDKAFHTAEMKKFKKAVMDLQKKGLDNKDILAFAKTKLTNDKAKKELEQLFAVVEINKLSDKEAREFILETVKANQSEGSSWLGRSASSAFIGLLVVLFIVLALTADSDGSYNGGYYEDCYDDYVCYETCYDYPFGSCYTDCYWETVCY